ncbi:MAG: peptidoglycan bridge formation glycyltransferase FemA/FemB family protein [Planctomycetota bacterium]
MSSLQCRIVDDMSASGWDVILTRWGGSLFFSSAHTDPFARLPGARVVRFMLYEKMGKPVALAAGVERRSEIPLWAWLRHTVRFEALPALVRRDPRLQADALSAIVRSLRQMGVAVVSFSSKGSAPIGPPLEDVEFPIREKRVEFVIDLKQDEDALWRSLSESHRRAIRKASPLEIETTRDPSSARVLFDLCRHSRRRRLARGEDYPAFSYDVFLKIHEAYLAHNYAEVFLVRHRSSPACAGLIATFAGHAYYLVGGSSKTGFDLGASYRLFWEMLRILRSRSVRSLNLGGCPAGASTAHHDQHGLFRFKKGFGAAVVRCAAPGEIALDPRRVRFADRVREVVSRWRGR